MRSTHQAVSPESSIRASPTISPICHAGGGRCACALNSEGRRKSRSLRVAKRISPRIRETRNVRISSGAWSRPITYQLPSCGSSAYGSIVRGPNSVAGDAPVVELQRPLLRDRGLELAQPARQLGRVVRIADLDAHGGLGRRLREARPAQREVLESKPERLGVRELPLEEVEAGLERGELVVGELERRQEVVLGAERVQLLARELVALGLERDAEGEQLRAIRVEAAGERLVRHLRVALDVLLDVARRERAALGHEERHQRQLADELVGVVGHSARLYLPRACPEKGPS